MDPQAALDELIKLAERYQHEPWQTNRKHVAERMAERVVDLRDWTANGGYQPRWPQRPLTDAELEELRASGSISARG